MRRTLSLALVQKLIIDKYSIDPLVSDHYLKAECKMWFIVAQTKLTL